MNSICKLCLKPGKLLESHIIPEFVYKSLYDENHRMLEVKSLTEGKVGWLQKGIREKMLCGSCENLLSRTENIASKMFSKDLPLIQSGNGRMRVYSDQKYEDIQMFILSVLWRCSVSIREKFSHVKLGPHEEILRNCILNNDINIAENYHVIILVLNFQGSHFKELIVQPVPAKTEGRRKYRIVMAGFVFDVFVCSRGIPDGLKKISLDKNQPVRSFDVDFNEINILNHVPNLVSKLNPKFKL